MSGVSEVEQVIIDRIRSNNLDGITYFRADQCDPERIKVDTPSGVLTIATEAVLYEWNRNAVLQAAQRINRVKQDILDGNIGDKPRNPSTYRP